jgi:hypothetical protein
MGLAKPFPPSLFTAQPKYNGNGTVIVPSGSIVYHACFEQTLASALVLQTDYGEPLYSSNSVTITLNNESHPLSLTYPDSLYHCKPGSVHFQMTN